VVNNLDGDGGVGREGLAYEGRVPLVIHIAGSNGVRVEDCQILGNSAAESVVTRGRGRGSTRDRGG